LKNFYYEAIYTLLKTPANHATKAAKLKHLKAKINRLHHEEQKCLFLSNDDSDRLEGKYPSLYHLLKARKRQESTSIQTLHDGNGVPQMTIAGILMTFKNYMYEKFGNISTDNEVYDSYWVTCITPFHRTRRRPSMYLSQWMN
jgi:hypothetical protein